ncbi:valine--tRNA ligase [Candidatus Nomurabacteria bacterium CG_4_9_14_0_2_um_filter_32_10]|uniref:Valine--tRNA ligase n=3 Tax=Candidatus Nomuraibacteriota TaxID=1752729 RepID=A0A2H0CI96_9BACT|nr:MAG: valine--tRNA ligase [Candidatus Nomurabacteria bacterium CG22_combo_CG10-13_8_21_14_all_32_8]PIZ86105.1 MAG: valine--tRNA ligase [Candidatus Nomurabacteria bacterium CG_4_10_14_0_2_um_filter_33_9]PJC49222.1 MAG: valine--tRNA ligase [Candidatus Nomurabacteria bacterium CG_4_9_14_0_2_um_filter_32_10]
MDEKLLKPYDPKETEDKIYKLWEESGFFNPDVCVKKGITKPDAETFTLIMPPTNANGSLHAGHGLVMAIEDIMVRYKRMQGFKTLWLPGLDHAGFETQIVYEKQLEKEGRTRFEIESKKLYKEILDFTLKNSKNIKSQIKKMGASCDWSREKFTLDDNIVKTVYQTFKRMYDDNLIYRGNRIVSWCSKHQTSFSDLEIKDEERIDSLYYLKYGPFVIATSRPETKFGDKYVVMHPDDKRYKDYTHGQKIELEWINGPTTATIIKDNSIDMEFGTGVMTITPWHDATDFEIAERHKLDKEQIIDEFGKLLPIAGEFTGQHIKKARTLIIEKLQKKGLIEKIDENYKHVIRTCYKCGTTIEPQIKNQWFVKMKPLAEQALEKINNKKIEYIPEHYQKITVHWLENIIDWNISRQIVWGIPIPAKICNKCENGMVDIENIISKCEKCGGDVRTDSDTFDTWFSSGQWPFATLGYPDNNDFKTFYPTNVMETAGEIIFFWVSRMIMLGLYITGEIPFKTVYLHGLVLDAKGQKMSKSKGNVIDPLILTEKFGTDAFRIGMIIGNTPGTSLALSEDKIRGYKNFANKIWNATRFVLENTKNFTPPETPNYDEEDKKSDEELKLLIKEITKEMDEYKFYIVAEKLYHYFWHTFADVIIERSKVKILKNQNADSAKILLNTQLTTLLKLLHPFIPFVTEEIWSIIKKDTKEKNDLLMVAKWPA